MFKKTGILLVLLFSCIILHAQTRSHKCGENYLYKKGYLFTYNITSRAAEKNTIIPSSDTVPVVFHVLLNRMQIEELGGVDSLNSIIATQLTKVNEDFNAYNSDTSNIPAYFRPYLGKASIHFALAHTNENGNPTSGIELTVVGVNGYDTEGAYGSQIGFSDAKYGVGGGFDAWDVSSYLNIWIIGMTEQKNATAIEGFTLSPLIIQQYDLPRTEMGIVLNYKNWTNPRQFRTLTHELGHFFSLKHIWGDDSGLCPNNGGYDDGIADTPPQANATFGCPTSIRKDNCTQSENGIMYMNYMDYTDDQCKNMFTKGQVARIQEQRNVGGLCYSLFLHPNLLKYPDSYSVNNEVLVYPNPAKGVIHMLFTSICEVKYIKLTNSIGTTIFSEVVNKPLGYYKIDVSSFNAGIYCLYITCDQSIKADKVVLLE